jgi:hypothetical protein
MSSPCNSSTANSYCARSLTSTPSAPTTAVAPSAAHPEKTLRPLPEALKRKSARYVLTTKC